MGRTIGRCPEGVNMNSPVLVGEHDAFFKRDDLPFCGKDVNFAVSRAIRPWEEKNASGARQRNWLPRSPPFPLSRKAFENGPQRSRARGVCAAEENLLWVCKDSLERTLEGEDRSGTWTSRESWWGPRGYPPGGVRGSAPHTLPRVFCAAYRIMPASLSRPR